MIALGIDIGGTAVKAAASKDGRVLWAAQSPFYAKPTTEVLRSAIRETVARPAYGFAHRWTLRAGAF